MAHGTSSNLGGGLFPYMPHYCGGNWGAEKTGLIPIPNATPHGFNMVPCLFQAVPREAQLS